MLVKIKLEDGSFLYRNVLRSNLRKQAKSIHSQFNYTDYASLEGVIFNALQKDMTVLVLDPPIQCPLNSTGENAPLITEKL